MRRAVLAVVLGGGLAVAAEPTASPKVTPIAVVDGVPFVDVRIGERGPFTFMIDTGADQAFVSPGLVAELGLNRRPTTEALSDARGERVRLEGVAELGGLTIGSQRIPDGPARVLDLSTLAGACGLPLRGILGAALFKDMVVAIDYPERTLTLRAGPVAEPDGRERLPLTLSASGTPLVELSVDGSALPVMIDTGSTSALRMAPDAVAKLADRTAFALVGTSVSASGQPLADRAARLNADVLLGTHVLRRPIIEEGMDSAIGGRYLKHFRLTLDFPRQRAWFERSGSEVSRSPILAPAIRTLGVSALYGSRGGEVVAVLEGSPAAKQVRLKDRIVKVEGAVPTREVISRLVETQPRVKLTLLRAGKTLEVTVPVLELLRP